MVFSGRVRTVNNIILLSEENIVAEKCRTNQLNDHVSVGIL